MVYLKSVENVITLGKLIAMLFLFCLPLLSILFLKTKRNDLARPVMGTIFLVMSNVSVLQVKAFWPFQLTTSFTQICCFESIHRNSPSFIVLELYNKEQESSKDFLKGVPHPSLSLDLSPDPSI